MNAEVERRSTWIVLSDTLGLKHFRAEDVVYIEEAVDDRCPPGWLYGMAALIHLRSGGHWPSGLWVDKGDWPRVKEELGFDTSPASLLTSPPTI